VGGEIQAEGGCIFTVKKLPPNGPSTWYREVIKAITYRATSTRKGGEGDVDRDHRRHGRGGDDPVHRTLKDFGTMEVSFYMV